MKDDATRLDATPTREGVIARLARRDEGAALAEVYAKVTMDADLRLSVERDPDFFALYDLEHGEPERRVIALEKDGRLEGVGAFLARDAYLDGAIVRTAYLTDLRFSPALRGGKVLGAVFPDQFHRASEALGAELMYTVVFDGNGAARKALVARDPRYPDKPLYRPLRSFVITSVLLAHPRPSRKTPFRVSRATEREMDEVLAFLHADQQRRPFGYVLHEGRFERRLRDWPGFGPERFYLARSARGTLVGCFAAWDAHDVKRYRVLGYRGAMRAVKTGYGAISRLLGARPLPPPGELLRYAYLSHLCVPSHDPGVLAALLDRAYADFRGGEHSFLTLYLEPNDPLRPALRGYLTSGMAATFYAVCAPSSPFATRPLGLEAAPGSPDYARPGFEMALA